jgi:hypothetical protein
MRILNVTVPFYRLLTTIDFTANQQRNPKVVRYVLKAEYYSCNFGK